MIILRTLQGNRSVYYDVREVSVRSNAYYVSLVDIEAELSPPSPSHNPVQEYQVPPEIIVSAGTATDDVLAWLQSAEGPHGLSQTLEDDQYALEREQASVFALIKRRRAEMEFSGLATSFGPVDSDADSQRRVSGAVQMAMLALDERPAAGGTDTMSQTFFPGGFALAWRFQDNSIIQLSAMEMVQLGVEVGKQVAQIAMVKNYLDAQVREASSDEELETIRAAALGNWLLINPLS